MAQPREEAPARADAVALKRLPAGPGELVFRGENASGRWSVYLSPAEAARTQSFQLAMLNAVVVLPERSSLKLIVNGRVLSTVPVRSAEKLSTVMVKIPPGVLTPGANDVQMRVALAHRVDCSVKATYELWALLDPTKTGFVLDGASASYAIHSLDDLAAEPAAEDGATRIHVRLPVDADPVAIGRAGRFVNAVVRRAGLLRPVVDVGPDEGQGAGLDLVMADAAAGDDLVKDLRVLDRENGVTIARDPATNRLVVVLSGADDADLDQQISNLEQAAPKTRVSPGRRRRRRDRIRRSHDFRRARPGDRQFRRPALSVERQRHAAVGFLLGRQRSRAAADRRRPFGRSRPGQPARLSGERRDRVVNAPRVGRRPGIQPQDG